MATENVTVLHVSILSYSVLAFAKSSISRTGTTQQRPCVLELRLRRCVDLELLWSDVLKTYKKYVMISVLSRAQACV